MKVGIVGYGFVGKALHSALIPSTEVFLVDPVLNTNMRSLKAFSPELTFICVPTPMKSDGSQDISILNSVFEEFMSLKISGTLILKSTVLPNNLMTLSNACPNMVFNPEFLREKYANDDFIKSKLIVLGGKADYVNIVANFYKKFTKCICDEYMKTDLVTASLVKYAINTFLATKITFFNELNHIFKISNAEDKWDNFIKILSRDERIGKSHMAVPGHDGKLGFGGACLPKDSTAMLMYAREYGLDFNVLNTVINVNNQIRAMYNTDERESSQNITFSGSEKNDKT